MVWYDFVILAILVYGVWQGASRGLVMQLAWIVAIVLCFKFADKLAPQIESHISVEPPLRHWIAMFILYLGFSLGSFLVARSLSNAIDKAKLKDFDRHLGGLFGLLKGAVLSLVVTFFAVTLSESLQETVVRSWTGNVACQILDVVKPLTPEDAHPLITESLDKYKAALHQGHDENHGTETSLRGFLNGQHDHDNTTDNRESEIDFPIGGTAPDRSFDLSYDTLLTVIPESMRDQMRVSRFQRQWDRLSADQRDEWITDLRYASPSEKPGLLTRLYTAFGGQGGGTIPAVNSGLIEQIAREYDYDDPQIVAVRIRQYLTGLPEHIQISVLEDWYADLVGNQRDPDPRTNGDSRIDDRILNQLSQAGMRIDQLTYNELRTRLSQSR